MAAPYLLVGNGRLSRHLQHYLDLEAIPWRRWERSGGVPLEAAVADARAVLVLIPDDAIVALIEPHAAPTGPPWVHCAGSLVTTLAVGLHPLMTFGDELYDLSTYRRIPFVGERGRTSFGSIFPELVNPHFEIDVEARPLYHALCAMAGNFTTLLWLKARDEFEARLGLPGSVLHPYLERVTANLEGSDSPLTGPLARGDRGTIESHLAALEGDPYHQVYRAFVAACDGAAERGGQ
jgi:predicted short-subunit dehydrogenase-like oxidoreductase (DUF2520 family)